MDHRHGYYIEDLSVGMTEQIAKTVTVEDIVGFAGISGDNNPIHLDDDYAAASPFKERIAHGMLSASFISAVLGTRLPGPGCIYMSQSLKFMAPVRVGDAVVASATIKEIDAQRRRIILQTLCKVGDTVVIDGEALMKVNNRP